MKTLKQHISEGLKKYYQEHPEKLYIMSQRHKEFYANNPQKAKEMSEIMTFAWNKTREGQNLIKDISKFAKRYDIKISAQELSNPMQIKKEYQSVLTAFWEKNASWAGKKLSIAIEKARKEIEVANDLLKGDSIPGVKISYNIIPTEMQQDMLKWAKSKGYDTTQLKFGLAAMYMQETKTNLL